MIAAHLGDVERAGELYELLSSCEGKLVYPGLLVFDSIPSVLGLLAATLGRPADAPLHFEAAVELETSIGAPGLLARTRARQRGVHRLDV